MTKDQIDQLMDDASCINSCIPPGFQLAVLIYLASQISSAGSGTGTGATFGNYGGGIPSFTPSSGNGLAVDTSTHNLWEYDNGNWNLLV